MLLFVIVAFIIAIRMLFMKRILNNVYRFERYRKWGDE